MSTSELDTDDSGSRTHRLAVFSAVAGVLLPPVGVIAGHLTLRRLATSAPLEEVQSEPRSTKRLARVGIGVGWLLTIGLALALALGIGYRQEQQAKSSAVRAEQQSQRELQRRIDASPSNGKVSKEFCAQLQQVADASPPGTGIVRDKSQITADLLSEYTTLSTIKSPNRPKYNAYVEHLKTFDSHQDEGKLTMARTVRTALRDDALACIPVTGKTR